MEDEEKRFNNKINVRKKILFYVWMCVCVFVQKVKIPEQISKKFCHFFPSIFHERNFLVLCRCNVNFVA